MMTAEEANAFIKETAERVRQRPDWAQGAIDRPANVNTNTANTTNPNHFASMKEDNWGTPTAVVGAPHAFFGRPPDLDPASDAFRNETIRAYRWLGLEHIDPSLGIPTDWGNARTLFINPPGGCRPDKFDKNGKPIGPSYVELFWRFAIDYLSRIDGKLIWVAYNINQLQTLQQFSAGGVRVASICVPDRRLRYLDRDGRPRSGTPAASAILCVTSYGDPHPRFAEKFGSIGAVWRP